MSPIRVLVADDQVLVRGALATPLRLESDLKIATQVGRGDKVLDTVRKYAADMVLVDIGIPGRGGLAAIAEAVGLDLPYRYLTMTTFDRSGYLSQGMEMGVVGFTAKDTPSEVLAEAIRRVYADSRVIDPELAQESVLLGPNPLTEREREVLLAAVTSVDVREIATRLSPGEDTVYSYLFSAIIKTRARNHTEAARIAETSGWL